MPDHAISDSPQVQAQLDRLAVLSPGRDVLGLERIAALCKRLGDPQGSLPPVFHVAGTNGKGSTCAFLRAAIEAAGLTCHVYTSPHLVRFNERIRLAGQLIEDAALARLLEEALDVADGMNVSFFEATTAAAFLAFARTPADACIIEVGLGGRLDATNLVRQPAVCGIASLGIDHEAFLLSPEENVPEAPLDRIAWEKAGIAKAGVPLICQTYAPSMQLQIANQAMAAGARLIDRGDAWNTAIYQGRLHYSDANGKLTLPLPRMPGAHQADNGTLAIAMLRHQDAIDVPESALAAAMEWANWPARLQKLAVGPLTTLLPDTEIWLDGGHNRQAGEAIAAHFEDRPARSLHLVIGMLSNKDPEAILAPLWSKIASITVVPVDGHAAHDAGKFREVAGALSVSDATDVQAAIASLTPGRGDEILIAGSLYLAGDVLRINEQMPD